jgi:hypothetical protein
MQIAGTSTNKRSRFLNVFTSSQLADWWRALLNSLFVFGFIMVFSGFLWLLFGLLGERDSNFDFVTVGMRNLGLVCGSSGAVLLAWVTLYRRQQLKIWEAFAHLVNGRLETQQTGWFREFGAKAVTFTHKGLELRLEDSKGLTFPLASSSVHCCVYPRKQSARGSLYDYPHVVTLGWRPFDDEFEVRTTDKEAAQRVLTRPVQESLIDLMQWSRKPPWLPGFVELSIGGRSLTVFVYVLFADTDDLTRLLESAAHIYELVTA